MKVLVVEDDPEVGGTISMAFTMRWPESDISLRQTGNEAIDAASKYTYDLVVLDVNLPDRDGFEVLEGIRSVSRVPVIMLTVRASEADKVRGLEMGADDYVAKPFSPFELLARAAAVLRRTGSSDNAPQSRIMRAGQIKVDPDTAEVFVNNESVKLTPTEFKILSMLLQNANKVVTRDAIIESV